MNGFKRLSYYGFSIVLIMLAFHTLLMANPTPILSNLTASQRTDALKKVDIYYSVNHNLPVNISVQASEDNGVTWGLPITLLTGDIGANISPGNGKHIVWDVLAEHPGIIYENVCFKVIADDGQMPPVPPDFVYVPGGTFTMGDTHGEGASDELPTHSVTVNSFYIGKYEVTQAEYSQYMQPGSSWISNYGLGDNYPAYYVSWYAILKYCNMRSMAEGLTPVYSISGSTNPANWGTVPISNNSTWDVAICNWNANGYRLPTEAEWEYAARGATNHPDYLYSGSDNINTVAWYSGNSCSTSHPVGIKSCNGLSLFDMSGNLWEWCWDWHSAYEGEEQINPTGPTTGTYRLRRGGAWDSYATRCRVSVRVNYDPYNGYSYDSCNVNGFRLCRTVN